ncbi:MAG: hypothetical protein JWR69_2868 [Pedosphaera sp.]|nr:hypothetical protein [Pedosphaera sp.]
MQAVCEVVDSLSLIGAATARAGRAQQSRSMVKSLRKSNSRFAPLAAKSGHFAFTWVQISS